MLYLFQQMKENISNQKGIRMFKYEIEIAAANEKYLECLNAKVFHDVDLEYTEEEKTEMDYWWAKISAFGLGENGRNLSTNTAIAIKKYYKWDNEKGYVRVKESNFIDRSDRDKFEKNEVEYPKANGLYMIGQTFVNPITDEKFYWIKVGSAANIARRRRDYNSMTAMVWDIGYYTKNDLTESECHNKLKEIALHRHADEWFSVSRENYLKICAQSFEWFKEDK